jgi:hypothetical protein
MGNEVGISIKGRGVMMFYPEYITKVGKKAGCGCTFFLYKGTVYKPTISLEKLKELIGWSE